MPLPLTLAVFAKAPIPGAVKTRLCPPLTGEQAARLYAAFVCDTVRAAQAVSKPTVFYSGDQEPLARLLAENALFPTQWQPQGDGDLGARMARVPAPCLILGTDSPHLPVSFLQEALDHLATVDVVLGPAEDGGYYLIGLRAPQPSLFEGIHWSTGEVLAQTRARAASRQLTTFLLPPWHDIDTIDDLNRLRAYLQSTSDADCPATRAALFQS